MGAQAGWSVNPAVLFCLASGAETHFSPPRLTRHIHASYGLVVSDFRRMRPKTSAYPQAFATSHNGFDFLCVGIPDARPKILTVLLL